MGVIVGSVRLGENEMGFEGCGRQVPLSAPRLRGLSLSSLVKYGLQGIY